MIFASLISWIGQNQGKPFLSILNFFSDSEMDFNQMYININLRFFLYTDQYKFRTSISIYVSLLTHFDIIFLVSHTILIYTSPLHFFYISIVFFWLSLNISSKTSKLSRKYAYEMLIYMKLKNWPISPASKISKITKMHGNWYLKGCLCLIVSYICDVP